MINCKAKLIRRENKVELLAPAGGKEQLIAAVENGADAVYFGGDNFNARINADNFDIKGMEEAVDFAHLHGVKTHIAMNTLLFGDELKEAYKYAENMYKIGADALIIQDFGLAELVHENLPDFEMHMSTQTAVTDESGLLTAKKLGFKRVVLSRELSLREIKNLVNKDITDIEIFAHGALCYAYSGQCQLSRYIGRRSGNRGVCAQPCRLLYENNGHTNHVLSTKDLSTLSILPEVIDTGVKTLKIEGRMKSPEYVATVTRIYRKYIDKVINKEEYKVEKEDEKDIVQIFNRGGFTTAFLKDNADSHDMSVDVSRNNGVHVGKVEKAREGHIGTKQLVDVKILEGEILTIGDIVEIRDINNKRVSGGMITYLKEIGGNRYRIGDLDGTIETHNSVTRIVSGELMKKAKATYTDDYSKVKEMKKQPIEFSFDFGSDPHEQCDDEEKQIAIIDRQLKKTGGTPFVTEKIDITGTVSRLKTSKINAVRREALDDLEKKIIKESKRSVLDNNTDIKIVPFDNFDNYDDIELYFHTMKSFTRYEELIEEGMKILLPAEEYQKLSKEERNDIFSTYGKICLYTTPVDDFDDQIMELKGIEKIYLGSFGNFYRALECSQRESTAEGIELEADCGCNVTNGNAEGVMYKLGAENVIRSLECDEDNFGAIPLSYTKWSICGKNIKDNLIIDRKKAYYSIIEKNSLGKNEDYRIVAPVVEFGDVEEILSSCANGRIYLN